MKLPSGGLLLTLMGEGLKSFLRKIMTGFISTKIKLNESSLRKYAFEGYYYISQVAWKILSDFSINHLNSFLTVVASILLYGCTTWTLTKRLEKKLDGSYTRILPAILNKSWRQHPTRHQLYGHLPPITKTIHVRQTRHARHCWRSRDELISDVL